MIWSEKEVQEANDLLISIEHDLSHPVSEEDLVACCDKLTNLVERLIADKRDETERYEMAEHMDENGD